MLNETSEKVELINDHLVIIGFQMKNQVQLDNIYNFLLRIAVQLAQIKIYIRSFPGVAILQIALKRGLTRLNHHNSTTMSMLTTRMYVWESMFIELMVI